MKKLTPLLVFLIILGNERSFVDASEGPTTPITGQALLTRSYRPELAYHILSRSTAPEVSTGPEAAAAPTPVLDPVATFSALQIPLRPALARPSPGSEPSAPPGLHPLVFSRLVKYDDHIRRYSRILGVEPNLVRALIYVESSGDPDAESPKGARGLMQLMPETASDMGVSNPFDPAQNIYGGTRYVGNLLSRFGRLDLALWAYNAGPEAVRRRRLPHETKRFIPEVLRIKSILDQRQS